MTSLDHSATVQDINLKNKRILIVEDEYLVAEEMVQEFISIGAEVVGPVPTLEKDFCGIEGALLDGAILDINLRGEMVYPVADLLRAQGVPFVFSTGYERWSIPTSHQAVPVCEKLVDSEKIAKALFG